MCHNRERLDQIFKETVALAIPSELVTRVHDTLLRVEFYSWLESHDTLAAAICAEFEGENWSCIAIDRGEDYCCFIARALLSLAGESTMVKMKIINTIVIPVLAHSSITASAVSGMCRLLGDRVFTIVDDSTLLLIQVASESLVLGMAEGRISLRAAAHVTATLYTCSSAAWHREAADALHTRFRELIKALLLSCDAKADLARQLVMRVILPCAPRDLSRDISLAAGTMLHHESLSLHRDAFKLLALCSDSDLLASAAVLGGIRNCLTEMSDDRDTYKCCVQVLAAATEAADMACPGILSPESLHLALRAKLIGWNSLVRLLQCLEEFAVHLVQQVWEASLHSLLLGIQATPDPSETVDVTGVAKAAAEAVLSLDSAWLEVVCRQACRHSNPAVRKSTVTALMTSELMVEMLSPVFACSSLVALLGDPALYGPPGSGPIGAIDGLDKAVPNFYDKLLRRCEGARPGQAALVRSLVENMCSLTKTQPVNVFLSLFGNGVVKPDRPCLADSGLAALRSLASRLILVGYTSAGELLAVVRVIVTTADTESFTLENLLMLLGTLPRDLLVHGSSAQMELRAWLANAWSAELKAELTRLIMSLAGTLNDSATWPGLLMLLRCLRDGSEVVSMLGPALSVCGVVYSQPYLNPDKGRRALQILAMLPSLSTSYSEADSILLATAVARVAGDVLSYVAARLFTGLAEAAYRLHVEAMAAVIHFCGINPEVSSFVVLTLNKCLDILRSGPDSVDCMRVVTAVVTAWPRPCLADGATSTLDDLAMTVLASATASNRTVREYSVAKWRGLAAMTRHLKLEGCSLSAEVMLCLYEAAIDALDASPKDMLVAVLDTLNAVADGVYCTVTATSRSELIRRLIASAIAALRDVKMSPVICRSFARLCFRTAHFDWEATLAEDDKPLVEAFSAIMAVDNVIIQSEVLVSCLACWEESTERCRPFAAALSNLLLYSEVGVNSSKIMAVQAEQVANVPSLLRVMVLLWLQRPADLAWDILSKAVLHSNAILLADPASKKKPFLHRRAWHAAAFLAPSLSLTNCDELIQLFFAGVEHQFSVDCRFFMEATAVGISNKYPELVLLGSQFTARLLDPNAPDQTVRSLLVVLAAGVSVAEEKVGPGIAPLPLDALHMLVEAAVPWLCSADGLQRTLAQFICHRLLPWVSTPMETKASPLQWRSTYQFLSHNKKIKQMRDRQAAHLLEFKNVLLAVASPERLSSGPVDQMGEFVPPGMVSALENTMLEVFADFYPPSSSPRPARARAADAEYMKSGSDAAATTFQRKISPWTGLPDLHVGSGDTASRSAAELREKQDVIVCASLVDKIPNLAGLARTCEIFAARKLVVADKRVCDDREFKAVSVTAEQWIDVEEVAVSALSKWLQDRRADGWAILCLEQTSSSIPLHQFKFPRKSVLLLGREKEGIPASLLQLMDSAVEIPQLGLIRSLNVHVTGAIMLWEVTRQRLVHQAEIS